MSQPFTLGVNYWPRRKAMYWWSDFDASEVEEEFALIEELGLQIVRIFLLWDDFQPTPTSVAHVDDLKTVADIAEAHHLKLDVTFFTGHMSGPNWSPGWLMGGDVSPLPRQLVSGGQIVTGNYKNPYVDPLALDAERLLLRTVVSALKDHPAIWMWNLGNEPDLFAEPPTDALGQGWVRDMTAFIKAIDAHHPVTCGLHMANLVRRNGLRVDQVYAETDVAVMHSYPMYMAFEGNPLDPDFVPFTCALTSSLSGRPVLMEEFGGCTASKGEPAGVAEWSQMGKPRQQFMASEEDLATFVKASLDKLVEVGTTGAMIWCFADYPSELWDRPPCSEYHHERSFGLVRGDGTVKPHARVIQEFAATHPMTRDNIPAWAHIDVTPDDYYSAPYDNLQKHYRAYLKNKSENKST